MVMDGLSRRKFVVSAGVAAAGVFSAQSGLAQPTVDMPGPGLHQVAALKYPPETVRGISAQVISWHHDTHYAGYVKKRNQIEEQIARLGPGTPGFDGRVYAGIKRDEAFNASGMILHEVYFDNLGGDGKTGGGPAEAALKSVFGSLEAWQADMNALAMQATGWALMCYDPSDGRLHDYLVEAHQLGAIWGAVPIVALDVFEHAYYRDFGPDRAKYLPVFFDNLHWGRINERFRAATGIL